MESLAARGCNRVLWECGPELSTAAIRLGCVQEIAAVIAPKLLGGDAAQTPLAELGFSSMDQIRLLSSMRITRLDRDLLIQSRFEG